MNWFEVYYAYLDWCERDNFINKRDSTCEQMEWHHILPQCLFKGHGPGKWLTYEQHSIASCIQSIAFKKLCHCGWHKKFAPSLLWELAKEATKHEKQETARQNGKVSGPKVREKVYEAGAGIFDPKYDDQRSDWCRKGAQVQKEEGLGIHNPDNRLEWIDIYRETGAKQGLKSYEDKTGLFDPANQGKVREGCSKGGKIGGKKGGEKAVRLGLGIHDPANADKLQEARRKGRETANKEKWKSTLDGFVSTAAGVASHNRSIGGSGKDKVKLPF